MADMQLRIQQGASGDRRCAKAMTEQIPKPKLPPAVTISPSEAQARQRAIGVQLRRMFDDVVSEPVPDSFLDILRRADGRSNGQN